MFRLPSETVGRLGSLPIFFVCTALLLGIAACSTADGTGGRASHPAVTSASEEPPPPYQPVEFAMPPGSKIDRDNTLVVGNNVQWFGTLTLTTDFSIDEANAYYSRELPEEGWELLSSLIADRVVLQFINRQLGRACIVTINSGRMWSHTHVEIVVAPMVGRTSTSWRASTHRDHESTAD